MKRIWMKNVNSVGHSLSYRTKLYNSYLIYSDNIFQIFNYLIKQTTWLYQWLWLSSSSFTISHLLLYFQKYFSSLILYHKSNQMCHWSLIGLYWYHLSINITRHALIRFVKVKVLTNVLPTRSKGNLSQHHTTDMWLLRK